MMNVEVNTNKIDIVESIGLFGLYVYTLSMWFKPSLAKYCLCLMLVMLIWKLPKYGKFLKREPAFWTTLVFSFYLVIRAYWGAVEFPETRDWQIVDTKNWLYLSIFPLIALWVRGKDRRVVMVLSFSFFSVVLKILRRHDWSCNGIFDGISPCSYGFFKITFGLICATSIIGLLVFAPRLTNYFRKSKWFWLLAMSWLVVLFLTVQGLISAQSRAAWLAALIVIPPIVIAYTWGARLHASFPLMAVSGVLIVSLIGITISAFNMDSIKKRWVREQNDLISVIKFDTENLGSKGSVVTRYHLSRLGFSKWLDRPVWGWGTGMRSTYYFDNIKAFFSWPEAKRQQAKRLLKANRLETKRLLKTNRLEPNKGLRKSNKILLKANRREAKILLRKINRLEANRQLAHLHNSYLEPLVRIGLVGVSLMALILAVISKYVIKAWRFGTMPFDIFMFILGSFLLLAIWSIADFQFFSTELQPYWIMLAGIAYSYAFVQPEQSKAGHLC